MEEKIQALIDVEVALGKIQVQGEYNLEQLLGSIRVVRNVRTQLQAMDKQKKEEQPCEDS